MNIQIITGKLGFHFKVNGLFIHKGFNGEYKAIKNLYGIPYGATEFVSTEEIHRIWNDDRELITIALERPYKSVWGELILIDYHEVNAIEISKEHVVELIECIDFLLLNCAPLRYHEQEEKKQRMKYLLQGLVAKSKYSEQLQSLIQ